MSGPAPATTRIAADRTEARRVRVGRHRVRDRRLVRVADVPEGASTRRRLPDQCRQRPLGRRKGGRLEPALPERRGDYRRWSCPRRARRHHRALVPGAGRDRGAPRGIPPRPRSPAPAPGPAPDRTGGSRRRRPKQTRSRRGIANQREQVVVAEREIDMGRTALKDTFIRAPFSGVSVSTDAQPGEVISPASSAYV